MFPHRSEELRDRTLSASAHWTIRARGGKLTREGGSGALAMDRGYTMTESHRLQVLVELKPDRRRAGRLRLLAQDARAAAAASNDLFRCRALGLADMATALKAGNPTRDPSKPFGDAPCGAWAGCRLVTRATFEPNDGIGPRWIPLHHSLAADEPTRRLLNPRRPMCRWQLGIHAGWGNGHLMLAQGCIRVRDEDLDRLAALIGDAIFDVRIVQAPPAGKSTDAAKRPQRRPTRELTI